VSALLDWLSRAGSSERDPGYWLVAEQQTSGSVTHRIQGKIFFEANFVIFRRFDTYGNLLGLKAFSASRIRSIETATRSWSPRVYDWEQPA
jgi:hypothetical protein